MAKMVKILSIDGGGIRGIIPAAILAKIEEYTGKPCSELFDLFAGTSTGGILALGLNMPNHNGRPDKSAKDLLNMYCDNGEIIFPKSKRPFFNLLGSLIHDKYPVSGLESILNNFFADFRLSSSIKDVLITSYEIEQRTPFFFKSSKARLNSDDDYPMRLVARATSAAPTYFEPCKIPINDPIKNYYALIDGGTFANNPAMCGYVELLKSNHDADILVLSLGTGEQVRSYPYDQAKDWGLIEWAQPTLNIMFDGVSDAVDYQLQQILPSNRYFRFQTSLNIANDDMDDASKTNINALQAEADQVIKNNEDKIKQLCALLLT